MTLRFGLGLPSVLGITTLTPDFVKANVSSKSNVDIPCVFPVMLNLTLLRKAWFKFDCDCVKLADLDIRIPPSLFILSISANDFCDIISINLPGSIPPFIAATCSLKYLSHQLFSKIFQGASTNLPLTFFTAIKLPSLVAINLLSSDFAIPINLYCDFVVSKIFLNAFLIGALTAPIIKSL